MLTTDFPPGVSTGRHIHPRDEYGTLMEGAVMTRQEGGEWKTVNAGQSYYVPANIIHETKNVGTVAAKAVNRQMRFSEADPESRAAAAGREEIADFWRVTEPSVRPSDLAPW